MKKTIRKKGALSKKEFINLRSMGIIKKGVRWKSWRKHMKRK